MNLVPIQKLLIVVRQAQRTEIWASHENYGFKIARIQQFINRLKAVIRKFYFFLNLFFFCNCTEYVFPVRFQTPF